LHLLQASVLFEVLISQDFMHKSCWPGPVVMRERFGKHRTKAEVAMLCCQSIKVVLIKKFLPGTGAIPEGHLTDCFLSVEQERQVRVQRGHSRAATQVDHFLVRILDQKVAERTSQLDAISSSKTVGVSGTDAGITILATRGRRNPNVEYKL